MQIRLQPTVTNNVVTYTVIIEAPNPDQKLLPGMTANITIITDSQSGLTVPVEATNFSPTPEMATMLGPQPDGAPMPDVAKGKNGKSGNSGGKKAANTATVWVKDGERIAPKQITTGINDGVDIIVKSGLDEGQEVILSTSVEKQVKGQPTSIMPGPRGPRR